jgi:homogentisate 1,2-dioxygenase
MSVYQRRGDVPRKRHVQFRENGLLLTEEVMGLRGFSGNESILYHLQSPCRVKEVGAFEPIEREEWDPGAHAHRHFRTMAIDEGGDAVSGRRLLMWNDDVEISLCRPSGEMDYFYRNGEGDEVIFVHEGSGVLETIFGELSYEQGDYIVVPRGTTNP